MKSSAWATSSGLWSPPSDRPVRHRTPFATGLFRRALGVLSVARFPASEQSLHLFFCHRSPCSPSRWLTAGIPTLPLVALAASIAASVCIGIIGSIGDREYHSNRGGTDVLPASRVTI